MLESHDGLVAGMEPHLSSAAEQHPYRMVRFDREGFQDLGLMDPLLASAIDIGPDLKLLLASPEDSEYVSAWESILCPCFVKNLKPGFIVVKLFADSFEDLDPDVDSIMFIVTSVTEDYVVLKDTSNIFIPGLLKDPEQRVLVVNEYGLDSVDKDVKELVWPVEVSAPGLFERQQKIGALSCLVVQR